MRNTADNFRQSLDKPLDNQGAPAMTPTRTLRFVAGLALLGLVASACGDDGADADTPHRIKYRRIDA
mgnify:CR=1 FL=1